MKIKCDVQSAITFDDLGLILQVSRRYKWAMLVHLLTNKSLGTFIRDNKGVLQFDHITNCDNPPSDVWATVSTMI